MNTPPALEPAIIIIFGITGDLAQRYILPSLYHLVKDNLLHEHTEIVGITRRDISAEELLQRVELCVNEQDMICDPVALKKMQQMLLMRHMDVSNSKDYALLRTTLDDIEARHGVCMNRLYYLSIPAQVTGPIVRLLGENDLNSSCVHGTASTRLLLEKPFGSDLASANALISETTAYFREEQIFRIDHYLAKETVQNIITFRLDNPLFEAVWNNQHIISIDIEASEKIGIERRVDFYEKTGALRDYQSHLLQIMAQVMMDLPDSLKSEAVHTCKQKLLREITPIEASNVLSQTIRGQYSHYREEVGNPDSNTETYAKLTLNVASSRWRGVPITLHTGKALHSKRTAVTITFGDKSEGTSVKNTLTFRLQPDEGISLELTVKKPGFEHQTQAAAMNFHYSRAFMEHQHPDAYERVVVDAIRGDHTLFPTSDEVLSAWRVVDAVLQEWALNDNGLQNYPTGSEGPSYK